MEENKKIRFLDIVKYFAMLMLIIDAVSIFYNVFELFTIQNSYDTSPSLHFCDVAKVSLTIIATSICLLLIVCAIKLMFKNNKKVTKAFNYVITSLILVVIFIFLVCTILIYINIGTTYLKINKRILFDFSDIDLASAEVYIGSLIATFIFLVLLFVCYFIETENDCKRNKWLRLSSFVGLALIIVFTACFGFSIPHGTLKENSITYNYRISTSTYDRYMGYLDLLNNTDEDLSTLHVTIYYKDESEETFHFENLPHNDYYSLHLKATQTSSYKEGVDIKKVKIAYTDESGKYIEKSISRYITFNKVSTVFFVGDILALLLTITSCVFYYINFKTKSQKDNEEHELQENKQD